jgi:integrase
LKKRVPAYWARLGKGQHIGYRKGATGGFWLARLTDPANHKRLQASLGIADDEGQPEGIETLSYDEAAKMAQAWFDQVKQDARKAATPAPAPSPNKMTVIQAVESYIEYLYSEMKGGKQAEAQARKYILSKPIGSRLVVQLTKDELDAWRKAIAESPRGTRAKVGRKPKIKRPRKVKEGEVPKVRQKGKLELEAESKSPEQLAEDQRRRRKSTSNRILTIMKSSLNRLVETDSTIDDTAWRKVTPYQNVDGIRTEYLEVEEQRRLIAACPPGLRELVMGALFTGARYSELTNLRVGSVFPGTRSIRIEDTKPGYGRVIPLSKEGARVFANLIAGKKKTDLVFTRPDGYIWGPSHVFRRMRAACDTAKVTPITFYELRHTYASLLIMAGAELAAVAEALGHKGTRTVEKHYRHLREGWVHNQIDLYSPVLFPDSGDSTHPGKGGMEPGLPSLPKVSRPSAPPVQVRRIARIEYDAPGGPRKSWREEPVPVAQTVDTELNLHDGKD